MSAIFCGFLKAYGRAGIYGEFLDLMSTTSVFDVLCVAFIACDQTGHSNLLLCFETYAATVPRTQTTDKPWDIRLRRSKQNCFSDFVLSLERLENSSTEKAGRIQASVDEFTDNQRLEVF